MKLKCRNTVGLAYRKQVFRLVTDFRLMFIYTSCNIIIINFSISIFEK